MSRLISPAIAALVAALPLVGAADPKPPDPWEKAVAAAAARPPMTEQEARAFIRALAEYVRENHLKTDPKSAQKGMVYEYFDTTRKGQFDQWVQGEALDTMHDAAWLAMAMANAYRATGDPVYREFLTAWQLPFYTHMLNHSDTLFTRGQIDVAEKGVRFNKEHALQPGEKGFCPYWWDDGASVSLERRRVKDPRARPPFECTDRLAGTDNQRALLSGYSHGSSNHLAQDLGPMLMLGWLLLRESDDPEEKQLAADCALAAKHLHECRMRHHGPIPAVTAPAALTNGDAELMKKVPGPPAGVPTNHYTRLLNGVTNPNQRHSTPGFADDMQYTYYSQLAKLGGKLPEAVLFKLVYDCYTEPMLFQMWSDNAAEPRGINRFDLAGGPYGKGGKFESYRSDRPVGLGSRFGPQNMVVCGLALQALDAHPGLWDRAVERAVGKDVGVNFLEPGLTRTISIDDLVMAPAKAITVGGATLELRSWRTGLLVTGKTNADVLTLEVIHGPDGKGSKAVVTLKRDDPPTAVSDDGEKLLVSGRFGLHDGKTTFSFLLPYTVSKGQGRWGNGVELGRYSVTVGNETRNFVLASTEKQVRTELVRELAGGLRTWEAVLAAKGYIPTGIGTGGEPVSALESRQAGLGGAQPSGGEVTPGCHSTKMNSFVLNRTWARSPHAFSGLPYSAVWAATNSTAARNSSRVGRRANAASYIVVIRCSIV
jgi:hypothetical protein